MRDENREIINEAMERMSEWDEYDKEDMPESVLEFKELLKLHQDIKSGRVSVVRHRKPKTI